MKSSILVTLATTASFALAVVDSSAFNDCVERCSLDDPNADEPCTSCFDSLPNPTEEDVALTTECFANCDADNEAGSQALLDCRKYVFLGSYSMPLRSLNVVDPGFCALTRRLTFFSGCTADFIATGDAPSADEDDVDPTTDGIDNDNDGEIDEEDEEIPDPLTDGIDNDNDGEIDEDDEEGIEITDSGASAVVQACSVVVAAVAVLLV